ncbi:class I SAM-dependent methyltransferase [Pseudomonas sp. PDM13]|uniref:class I SAM-dependent methyltransferase n=1 Tax=Pseudomonas sp. PDM13 TaxID=2769255 RepID=UPI0021E00034|nr:class I SAM-dependent methyltransferase [Pseudomonas sp. PDM13]MCU9950477.1 class I SAM-dependent methyltransferase [Pseudomonas sp. PDM13]
MTDSLYYDRTQSAPPWPALLMAIEALGRPGTRGIDLGCGAGRDTLEMLRRGWEVLAIDREPEAIERLLGQVSPDQLPRLQPLCARFEDCELPPADIVNSAFALPFCAPADFPALWQRIDDALAGGGIFCGNLFGERDDWAGPELSIFSEDQVRQLFADWELLHFEVIDREGSTARGRTKRWHLFSVVARHR